MKKKKILIASLALTFSLSVGTVFASVNAGEKLQQWYEGRFQQSVSDINENTVQPLSLDMGDKIATYAKELIAGSKERIEESANNTTWYHVGSIFIHNGRYIDQIRTKQDDLKKSVTSEFDTFISNKNQEVNDKVDEVAKYLLTDLSDELDGIVKDTTSSLQLKANEAQEDLSKTIEKAKSQLREKVDSEKSLAEKELTDYIDNMIEKAKLDIATIASNSSSKNIQTIQEKGSELENQAYDEMSNIILNIN